MYHSGIVAYHFIPLINYFILPSEKTGSDVSHTQPPVFSILHFHILQFIIFQILNQFFGYLTT